MNKILFCVFGLFSIVAFSSTVFAAQPIPIRLDCPAGTKQAKSGNGKSSDIVACVKTNGAGFSPHGPTVYFYPNGEKQAEGPSEDGFRTGLWTFYDEQGKKTGTATFKQSNFHGEVVEFHENGRVKRVEYYVDGLREGITKEYSANGELVKQTAFRNNREVTVK